MISRSALKESAKSLRLSGKSYREIATLLHISISSAHAWSKEIILAPKQIEFLSTRRLNAFQAGRKIGAQARKTHRISREKQVALDAKNEFRINKSDAFFMTGLSLYWAEGFKKDHSLGFVNSDPIMCQIFLKWLVKYGAVDQTQLRARLHINRIYQINSRVVEEYWSTLLHIPLDQFQTPFFQESKIVTSLDPSYRGQIRIRAIGTRNFFVKILCWIDELKKGYKSKV